MASIQRVTSELTNAVSYRAQVRVKGHPTQSKYFPTKKEAQQWATSIEAAIRENRYFPQAKAAKTTFAETVARYRNTHLNEIKPSGRKTREQHLDWWLDRFAGLRLAEITPESIALARDELSAGTYTRAKKQIDPKTGKTIPPQEFKRSGSTVNRYLATLSHLFTIAVREWRLIDRNPARDITKKKEARGRTRFLSDEEREALLDACGKSDWKPLLALVLLALSTGARRGELINLKWKDIDLKEKAILIEQGKGRDPKLLPIVGKAEHLLKEMFAQKTSGNEFVFPQPSGFPGPYEHFDTHWYRALETAKLNDVRFHDLRHTTASYLAQQGASMIEVADTLGHRTLQMVKRYAHLSQPHKVTALERMAKKKGL